jgi:threonine/homoserine/homoserine lactone efflux protein
VKYAGAAYLIYLGVRRLLDGDGEVEGGNGPAGRKRLFWQGVVVNSLNPKTALFFLAFLPQFVDPDRGAVAPQVLALGVLFLVLATLSDSTYALVAGSVRPWLGERRRRMAQVSGVSYIGLGLLAAFSPGERSR